MSQKYGRGGYAMTRDFKGSHTEKGIARKAFERALKREFHAVIRTAKEMAAKIEQPADLWDLESYLTKSRREIDRKYDYRYSVLVEVFGSWSEKVVYGRKNCVASGRISWSLFAPAPSFWPASTEWREIQNRFCPCSTVCR